MQAVATASGAKCDAERNRRAGMGSLRRSGTVNLVKAGLLPIDAVPIIRNFQGLVDWSLHKPRFAQQAAKHVKQSLVCCKEVLRY